MVSSRLGWHTWHTAVFLVLTAAWSCGGKASSGAGGSSSGVSCDTDDECASGQCVEGHCASGVPGPDSGVSTGAGGTAGAGGVIQDGGAAGIGVPGGTGGVHGEGGCSGAFTFDPEMLPATGGSGPLEPTCDVDEQGLATTSLDVLCAEYRCSSSAMDLVSGLDCSEVVTMEEEGIVLVSGCGYETVKVSGTGFTYQATFGADGLIGLREWRGDRLHELTLGCTAYGFKAGEAKPECAEEVRRRCVRPAETGADTACRDPGQEGCAACCTPWSDGTNSGCTIATSTGSTKAYDSYWGENTACACNCPPCATCTTEIEYNLRTFPEKPECDCPPAAAGGAGGAGGSGGAATGGSVSELSPCELYCSGFNSMRSVCPDVPR